MRFSSTDDAPTIAMPSGANEAIQDIRASTAALTASNERMDQLLEYVIRRDREQMEMTAFSALLLKP